jgi:hypothetical protein
LHGSVVLRFYNFLFCLVEIRPALRQFVFLFAGIERNNDVARLHCCPGVRQADYLQSRTCYGWRDGGRGMRGAQFSGRVNFEL